LLISVWDKGFALNAANSFWASGDSSVGVVKMNSALAAE
jgi:hypothetical protein